MEKEIIIKIEEETYNRIMNGWMPLHKAVNLMENIQKGTPLPKGHGRLIDVDCLREDFKASKKISFAERMDISCIVDHAPTVIEAEESEKND